MSRAMKTGTAVRNGKLCNRVAAGCLAAAIAALAGATAAAANEAHVYRTKLDGEFRETVSAQPSTFTGDGLRLVDLDAATDKWPFLGLGTSFPEGSCHLIMSLPAAQRREIVEKLFGAKGAALSIGRIHCGSSDYSRHFYTYDDVAGDRALANFSIEPDRKEIIPVIREAMAVNPDLYLFSSTWSPPAWMKEGGSLFSGALREDCVDVYADYLVKFFKAYADEGLRIRAYTAQNEPGCEQQHSSPTCDLPAAREIAVIKSAAPKIRAAGLDVKPWLLDFNFICTGRVDQCLQDAALRPLLGGIAWHCYGGRPEDIREIRRKYPDIEMYETEFGPMYDTRVQNIVWWGDIVLRTINAGCGSFVNWCPVLDEDGEPNASLGFPCWGLLTLDSRTKAVTESEQYRVFRHIGPYVRRGARVLEAPLVAGKFFDAKPRLAQLEKIVHTAFRNPDGSHVVVFVGHEEGDAYRPWHRVQVQIKCRGRYLPVQVAMNAVTTVVLPKEW